jgi:diguanylate cyclase
MHMCESWMGQACGTNAAAQLSRVPADMTAVGRVSRAGAWFVLLVLPIVGCYFVAPQELMGDIGYYGFGWATVVAMAFGIVRYKPAQPGLWWLLAAGQLTYLLGDVTYRVERVVLHSTAVPSIADVFYFAKFLAYGAGLLLIVRRRTPGRDSASIIDASVVAVASALLSWVFLMQPVVRDASLGLIGQLVAISYPALDLMLLALTAWLLVRGGARNRSFRLLAASLVVYLAGDSAFIFVEHAVMRPGALLDVIGLTYLVAYGLQAAAALHPSMAALAQPVVDDESGRMSRTRIVMLTATPLLAPALLVWQWYVDGAVSDAGAIGAGCAAMFLLVAVRMVMLVRRVEAQAIVLRAQADRLASLADRDELTGLLNRRAWNAAVPAALDRARRSGEPVTLAILDLDHFKRFNDEHGHQAGDRLLQRTSAAWGAALRRADLLARYGGEEFVVLLPGLGVESAVDLLDRLRVVTPMGSTFSAGVAEWEPAETADELLARADEALYRAKAAGRNCTVMGTPIDGVLRSSVHSAA